VHPAGARSPDARSATRCAMSMRYWPPWGGIAPRREIGTRIGLPRKSLTRSRQR
jgi:hypothetical protein